MNRLTENAEKGERIFEAISYLKMKGVIKEQKDLAKIIDRTESSISRAINGKEGYGDGIIKKLTELFPELNYEYLMLGEEKLLLSDVISSEYEGKSREYYMAKYADSLEIIIRQNDEIKSLNEQIENLKKSSNRQSIGTNDASTAQEEAV